MLRIVAVVSVLLLHCSGWCNGSPSAVGVVDASKLVRPKSGAVLEWRENVTLNVASKSSWVKGLDHWNSWVIASLYSNVCFIEGGEEGTPFFHPASLAEIDEIQKSGGKDVPSTCFDAKKSIRAAALGAGASSMRDPHREGRLGQYFAACGEVADLDSQALEVAQREYAYLLGGSKESVPLEQTIVIRRPAAAPRRHRLREIVVTRKNADVYENFQLGYVNKRVESEAWSDEIKSAFDKVQKAFPASADGDELVYVDNNRYLDRLFSLINNRIGETESLKIDIQGNTYEWQPTKTDRFLNPKESSDWEDGFSKKFDPSLEMYRLFALAPWKSDETGTELILDIEGACKSSKDDNSDLKAVALIINRLDKPNIDTSEAQNVYAIYDDLFFAVGDEVNPTVSRICKNRVIGQLAEVYSLYGVLNVFIEDLIEGRMIFRSREGQSGSGERRPRSESGERRPRSESGERRPRSRTGSHRRRSTSSRENNVRPGDMKILAVKRVLLAMTLEGKNGSEQLPRSESGGVMMEWPALNTFLKSQRKANGLQAESGVVLIRLDHSIIPKGTEADLWHMRNAFRDPRKEATKLLLKKSSKARKNEFLFQSRDIHEKKEIKKMIKELIKTKEACKKDKKLVLIKEKSVPKGTSCLFEVETEKCLDAIFEVFVQVGESSVTQRPLLKDMEEKGTKSLFIRLRKDLPSLTDETLEAADPMNLDVRSVFSDSEIRAVVV